MKYKAIFSDFDGTLLSDDFTVSKKNIEALNEYVDKGGKFFISTGRLFQSIYPHLVELGVPSDMIICAQGAEVYDIKEGKKLLLQETIPLETLKKIARFLESQYEVDENLLPLMYVNDEVYFVNRNENWRKKFCELLGVKEYVMPKTLDDFAIANNVLPTKVNVMMTPEKRESFLKAAKEVFPTGMEFCSSRDFLVEIMPSGVDKGTAVKYVVDQYGWKMDEVICVGDSDNDIKMVEKYYGVAVENASDSIKKVAKYISSSCNDDALYDVVHKLCLGE